MKIRMLGVAIALVLAAAPSHAQPADSLRIRAAQTGWSAPDKLQHASLSFTLGLMLGVATREPGIALGGATAAGVGKELWDMRRTRFDRGDLLADLLGAAAAALLTRALDP